MLIALFSSSQKVNISIFNSSGLKSVIFHINSGGYQLIDDNGKKYKIGKNENITVSVANDRIKATDNPQLTGSYSNLRFIQTTEKSSMKIKPVFPGLETRRYNGEFIISCKNQILRIINNIALEDYISGVVESEGGEKSNIEYYKTQAIICRTYAIGHTERHREDGFQLCDGVHCQVYLGMSTIRPEIPESVKATEGLVITDNNKNLITAVFHSNCGGETVNSENVWSHPKPYLVSVQDTFCLNSPHAKWEQLISAKKWMQYLSNNGLSCSDSINSYQLDFDQYRRRIYYSVGYDSIPLKKIRADWDLKSTWFSIIQNDSILVLKGKGFGHGIGLCQEGAMVMAERGYKYPDIIKHYYYNVKIIKR